MCSATRKCTCILSVVKSHGLPHRIGLLIPIVPACSGWLCHSLKVKQTQQSRLGSSPGSTGVNFCPVTQLYIGRVGGKPLGAFAFLHPPITKVETRYKEVQDRCLLSGDTWTFKRAPFLLSSSLNILAGCGEGTTKWNLIRLRF